MKYKRGDTVRVHKLADCSKLYGINVGDLATITNINRRGIWGQPIITVRYKNKLVDLLRYEVRFVTRNKNIKDLISL
jgi:hypothetical protein